MIAEEGGTIKVSGSTMATPFTDPSPGIAPMNNPAVTPRMTIIRLTGDSDVAKPSANSAKVSMIAPPSEEHRVKREEERLGKSFWQKDFQWRLEEKE